MATRPNQAAPVIRAGIYTRISWDPDGHRAGVERQRVDCEAMCAACSWEVAEYFEDNDRSAYTGKRRSGYERLLAARRGAPPRRHRNLAQTGCTARRGSSRPSSAWWSEAACG